MTTFTTKKPWYQQFWPWVLIILPLSVVVASFITLGLVLKHPDQEVTHSNPHGLVPVK